MHIRCPRRYVVGFAICTAVLVGLAMWVTTAHAAPLRLSDRPLFSGGNAKPNILVAVDDSGSMDFETLFPTDSGLLYWDPSRKSSWTGSDFVQSGGYAYAYLFPNGFNDCHGSGCPAKDRRIYSNYYAAPPIPVMAFARSPVYNKAYFDPAVKEYSPWLGMDDIEPTAAPSDPVDGSHRLDLTSVVHKAGDGYMFWVADDMRFANVTYNKPFCIGRFCFPTRESDWETSADDHLFQDNQLVAIEYFPATFYLPEGTAPPAHFGWDATAPTLEGYAPDGQQTLTGYEIKPDHFETTADYDRAIQNFANWYTYYRKRHLATRAGITTAFDQISGARVGACTINQADQNNPPPLQMLELDAEEPEDRQDFYNQIFDIDFSQARGTPNRPALKFLGEQLETNEDIIQSSCQQNFALLFTDGYNTSKVAGIGNRDQSSEARKLHGAPFGDNYSNTIADVAMRYYEDLGKIAGAAERGIERDEMAVPVGCDVAEPDPWLDCESDLHMVTFGITLGQRGVLFDPDADYDREHPYLNPPDWSKLDLNNDSTFGLEQIDDLWHATINSRGTLLNARTPQQIAGAFATALEEIVDSGGSQSALSANSRSLTADSMVFQASFKGGAWQGKLEAYRVSDGEMASTPRWSASALLSQRPPQTRTILTALPKNDTAYSGYIGTPFRADALPDDYAGLNDAVIAYLRGARENERRNDGEMRNRGNNILGDIVHSTPAYVGKPERVRYPIQWRDFLHGDDSARFPENSAGAYNNPEARAFAQRHANRDGMVYVGANDGMLHGFDADTGEERLAYIPGEVLPRVSQLTKEEYRHRYFVDGSPAIGDVAFSGAWHTVLVSGLNNGGRSVFALDVTEPDSFGDSASAARRTVLWEYRDDGLGQTFGQPSIVRLHNGDWAAMFGNGYNSDTGRASLYLVDIATGELLRTLRAGAAPVGNAYPNGLSEPSPVDVDGDFITDYAYAGDLYGNVWRFDLTATEPSGWSAAKLFTARNVNGAIQPITTAPAVGLHSFGRNYGVMVYFGTGKYIEIDDASFDPDKRNSFYGVWDTGTFNFRPSDAWRPASSGNLTRASLARQRVLETVDANGNTYRVVSDNPVVYKQHANDDGVRGWVLDMPEGTGELIVSNPVLEQDVVMFSTTVPDVQVCTAEGSGYFMAINTATGGRTPFPTFDLNDDAQFDAVDDTVATKDGTNGRVAVSGIEVTGGAPNGPLVQNDPGQTGVTVSISNSIGDIVQLNLDPGGASEGRVSWREIRR